jgi:hypothetical protein
LYEEQVIRGSRINKNYVKREDSGVVGRDNEHGK